jgi:S-adenosylmethionine decarboxylase
MSISVSHAPYQGVHLLADLHGAHGLDDAVLIEAVLRNAAEAAGATLLDLRLHHFGPGQGVTGVALLAESHISIHSWPERGYAAIDIFVCGATNNAEAARDVIAKALQADTVDTQIFTRGYSADFTSATCD